MPYIKGQLFTELLSAVVGELRPQQNPDPTPQDLPRSWDDVAGDYLKLFADLRAAHGA